MKRSGFQRKDSWKPLTRGKGFKPGRPRRSGIKIDPADRFFSLFIRYRANWKCEYCLTQYEAGSQGLHASHFWSRGKESVRFDPENVSAHCFSCHTLLGGNPELHRAWKLKQMGQEAYDRLTVRAQLYQKKDRKLMAIICKKLYEEEKQRFENSVLDN